MADRTVTTRLKLDTAGWTAGSNNVSRDLRGLNRQFTESAGFAQGFRKQLENATKRLPPIEIDVNSGPAEIRLAVVRAELDKLSRKEIGVDIDVDTALGELAALQGELADLESGASFEVRAAVGQALADLAAVSKEVSRLDGRTAEVTVDVDTSGASAQMAAFGKAAGDAAGDAAGGAFALGLRAATVPALSGALLEVATVVGPMIGSALGGAIVIGAGAGLTQLGMNSLMWVEKIDDDWSAAEQKHAAAVNRLGEKLQFQFRELNRDLVVEMQKAARPLLGVLDTFQSEVRKTSKELGPSFAAGFEEARVPLERFIKDAGAGVRELGKSIPGLMRGFGDVLGQIDIEGFLADLGVALEDLARTVSAHKAEIGTLLEGLLYAIPLAINAVSGLINAFSSLASSANHTAARAGESWAALVGVITNVGTRVLETVRLIGQALSNVPGAEDLGKKIVEGADAGIAKLRDYKKSADEASNALKLRADIFDLERKIGTARALLDDPNLTKERRTQLTADIQRLLQAKGEALIQLGDPKLVAEYRSQITTEIGDLLARLAQAKKELQDKELSKERKSRLDAEISQLLGQVNIAKAALDSVKDKTVTLTIEQRITQNNRTTQARGTAMGSIDRYAAGGITRMAAGGLRPQPPHVVSKPTVLYGEGSSGRGATEAFIPYEPRFRDRAIDLLGQVASDFGLEVFNRQAARRVDNLGATLNETQHSLVGGMASAASMLSQTLGSAGSLTSSINNVGVVGEVMTAGWVEGSTALGDSVGNMTEVMSGSVAGLTASVQDLAGVIGEAASWSAERMSSTNSDTYEDPRRGRQRSDNPRSSGGRRPGGSQGSIIPPKPKPKPGGSQGAIIGPRPDLPPPGVRMPNGDFIAFKAGGIIDRPTYALMGEAGREAVVPLDDRKRGRAVLEQAAQMLGVPTNRSKVSRPQQMRSYAMAAPQAVPGGGAGSGGGSPGGGRGGALVNVESLQVREHADIDRIGAALYSRLGDKGP